MSIYFRLIKPSSKSPIKKYVEGVKTIYNQCEVISIAIVCKGKEIKMQIIEGDS